jgi:hypothetical protein
MFDNSRNYMNFKLPYAALSFPSFAVLAIALTACSSPANPAAPGGSAIDAGEDGSADAGSSRLDSSAPDTGSSEQILDSSSVQDSVSNKDSAASEDSGNPSEDEGGSNDAASAPDSAQASPYAVSCTAASSTCPGTPLVCQSFGFGGGAITGYACTQTCSSVSDCGAAPAGFSLACQAYTTGGFCVITCDPSSATSCPSPLECTADEGQAQGICVSF